MNRPKNFIEIWPINFKDNMDETHILINFSKHDYGKRANLEICPASEILMLCSFPRRKV